MKTIKTLNKIAIGLPAFFGLLGFVWETFWGVALLSVMLTGLLQVVAAIMFWRDNPENNLIKVYFAGVAIFFVMWLALPIDMDIIILILPPALCILLCWIIYTQNTVDHESE
jgi:hypothetical protein